MSLYSSSIFSDEELLEELKKLGHDEVSSEIFSMIKDDLVQLFEKEQINSPTFNHLPITDSFGDLNIADSSCSFGSFLPRKTRKKYSTEASRCGKPSIQKQRHFDVEFVDVKDKNISNVSPKKEKPKRSVKSQRRETDQNNLESPSNYNSSNTSKKLGLNRKTKSPEKVKNDQAYTKRNFLQTDSFSNSDSLKQKTVPTEESISLSRTSKDKEHDPTNFNPSSRSKNLVVTKKSRSPEKRKKDPIETKENEIQANSSSNSNSFKQGPSHLVGSKVSEASLSDILKKTDSDSSVCIEDSRTRLVKNLNLNVSSGSSTSSETTIKRKILRRRNGQSVVTEEFHKIPNVFDSSYPESESLNNSKSSSSMDLSPKSNSSSGSVSVVSPESSLKKSTSVLSLSSKCSTATRILNSRKKKHDPVAMYGYYKKFWDNFKPPGEKTHDKLRWAIRDRMLDYNL